VYNYVNPWQGNSARLRRDSAGADQSANTFKKVRISPKSFFLDLYMHYYQFNIGDYQTHTNHLTELEDLAYRRMIDWCYLHEKPLPNDVDEIARLIRMRTHCDCIANVLREFFYLTNDGYMSERVTYELEQIYSKSDKARSSANKRWNKIKGLDKDANAMRTHSEGNATHNTLPNNTIPNIKDKKTGDTFQRPEKIDNELWSEFNKICKVKNKPIGNRVWKKMLDEANLAGWSIDQVLEYCCEKGYARFEAEWLKQPNNSFGNKQAQSDTKYFSDLMVGT
jgi:uncharacterized protein YdaU (DUF1376 family)